MGLLSLGLGVAKGFIFFQYLFLLFRRLAFNAAFDIMLDSNLSPLPMSRTASGNATGSEAPPLARTLLPSTTTG